MEAHTSNANAELAEMLVKCRAERNLKQHEVAKALHLSVSGLSQIERGEINPLKTTRLRIVAFLNKHGYFPKTEAA